MPSLSFQIKLRGPDQSGRGSSYFQRSSAGWTKGASGVRRKVSSRKLTRASRSAGSLEDSSGIRAQAPAPLWRRLSRMAWNDVAPSKSSKSISIPNSSPMTLRRLTWATESHSAIPAAVADGMAAGSRLGKTVAKQAVSLSLTLSIFRNHLVEHDGALRGEAGGRQIQPAFQRAAGKEPAEKFLKRPIARRGPETQGDAAGAILFEQAAQHLKLDLAAEGAATEDPGIHLHLRLGRAPGAAAGQSGNLAQRSETVLVGGGEQKGAGLLEKRAPFRLRKAPAIEVELVGLIDQLQSAAVIRGSGELQREPGFQARLEVSGMGRPLAGKRGRGAQAADAEPVFLAHLGGAEARAQAVDQIQNAGGIARGKAQAFDRRKAFPHLGQLHRAVIHKDHAAGADVPGLENSRDALRFRSPAGGERKNLGAPQEKVGAREGIFHQRRVVLGSHGDQSAGLGQ